MECYSSTRSIINQDMLYYSYSFAISFRSKRLIYTLNFQSLKEDLIKHRYDWVELDTLDAKTNVNMIDLDKTISKNLGYSVSAGQFLVQYSQVDYF